MNENTPTPFVRTRLRMTFNPGQQDKDRGYLDSLALSLIDYNSSQWGVSRDEAAKIMLIQQATQAALDIREAQKKAEEAGDTNGQSLGTSEEQADDTEGAVQTRGSETLPSNAQSNPESP